MKIIDKLLIIAMGLIICHIDKGATPLILVGALPVIYSILYLIHKGIEEELC